MKEAFEKILGQLEERRKAHFRDYKEWGDGEDYRLSLEDEWAIKNVNQVAEEYAEKEFSEWCHDCPAYDKENHHCPRLCKVIRTVVEEIKGENNSKWIPCSERLPERNEDVLVTVDVFGEMKIATATYLSDDEWFFDDEYYSITSIKWDVIAWQPLPAPYKPKGE